MGHLGTESSHDCLLWKVNLKKVVFSRIKFSTSGVADEQRGNSIWSVNGVSHDGLAFRLEDVGVVTTVN